MGFFSGFLVSILAVLVVASLFFTIKNRPEMFSKENLSRSFFTMGMLALVLIAMVGIVVMLLRAH